MQKITLYPFQAKGVRIINHFKGTVLLADEMGLGKSVMGMTYCLVREELDSIKKVLVVCPNSIKDSSWGEDIRNYVFFCAFPFSIYMVRTI